MSHGSSFNPQNEGEINVTAAEAVEMSNDDSLLLRPFSPLDNEARQRIQDSIGELWPATIQAVPEPNQTGGSVIVRGDGWQAGSTVTFYLDGIARRNAPLAIGRGDSVSATGKVEGYFEYRAAQVPVDEQTEVTLRAEGGGESASCPVPSNVFYIDGYQR